jgi:hypothetical protein
VAKAQQSAVEPQQQQQQQQYIYIYATHSGEYVLTLIKQSSSIKWYLGVKELFIFSALIVMNVLYPAAPVSPAR